MNSGLNAMAHTLQINLSDTSVIHQHNIMDSLAYRLEAARAARNPQLVALLEQEKQQLVADAERQSIPQSLKAGFNAVQQQLDNLLFGGTTLQVREFHYGSDHWWYAVDPQTGQCVYADSEVELRLWIKQNYKGK